MMRCSVGEKSRPSMRVWYLPAPPNKASITENTSVGSQTISLFGSQISDLALPFVAILTLKATTFEVAALAVVDRLPFVLFTLPAGVWVDRLRRRPILIAADWGRGAALVSIPVAYAAGVLTLSQLYVVGFLTGTLTVFFDVAYQSYLPSLVERHQLADGNAKLQTSGSAASVVIEIFEPGGGF